MSDLWLAPAMADSLLTMTEGNPLPLDGMLMAILLVAIMLVSFIHQSRISH